MLKRSTLETLMGLVVLTGAAIFAMLVYQASNIQISKRLSDPC